MQCIKVVINVQSIHDARSEKHLKKYSAIIKHNSSKTSYKKCHVLNTTCLILIKFRCNATILQKEISLMWGIQVLWQHSVSAAKSHFFCYCQQFHCTRIENVTDELHRRQQREEERLQKEICTSLVVQFMTFSATVLCFMYTEEPINCTMLCDCYYIICIQYFVHNPKKNSRQTGQRPYNIQITKVLYQPINTTIRI